jgi:hypothetical protein
MMSVLCLFPFVLKKLDQDTPAVAERSASIASLISSILGQDTKCLLLVTL